MGTIFPQSRKVLTSCFLAANVAIKKGCLLIPDSFYKVYFLLDGFKGLSFVSSVFINFTKTCMHLFGSIFYILLDTHCALSVCKLMSFSLGYFSWIISWISFPVFSVLFPEMPVLMLTVLDFKCFKIFFLFSICLFVLFILILPQPYSFLTPLLPIS